MSNYLLDSIHNKLEMGASFCNLSRPFFRSPVSQENGRVIYTRKIGGFPLQLIMLNAMRNYSSIETSSYLGVKPHTQQRFCGIPQSKQTDSNTGSAERSVFGLNQSVNFQRPNDFIPNYLFMAEPSECRYFETHCFIASWSSEAILATFGRLEGLCLEVV